MHMTLMKYFYFVVVDGHFDCGYSALVITNEIDSYEFV
jgi:hypothetical protein